MSKDKKKFNEKRKELMTKRVEPVMYSEDIEKEYLEETFEIYKLYLKTSTECKTKKEAIELVKEMRQFIDSLDKKILSKNKNLYEMKKRMNKMLLELEKYL